MANSPPTVISYAVNASGGVDVEYSDGTHATIPGSILIGTDGNPYSATGGGGGGGATTVADGADVTQGHKADAASTATDATPITIVQILKQISKSVQAGIGGGAVTIADGANVAQGTTSDLSTASTVIGLLKNLKAALAGTIAVSGTFWQATQPVSGTVTANAGTSLNTSALALEAGNLATLAGAVSASKVAVKSADGDNVTVGTTTDLSTANTLVGLLKNIKAALAGTLITTANAGTNLNTSLLALETGGNLASIKTDVDKIPAQGSAAASASTPVAVAIPENSTDSQVSVLVTSGVLLATRAKRKRAIFKNTDATNPIFINFANGTATTANFPLKAGESVEMQGSGATKAISTGGTVLVNIIEEYYS